ncbi:ribosomal protein L4 domain-containing protein [Crucibulum laeve]|uniref:Large ribosomal subunit protein uL4m n=1 Tax=Crucibulum laeve TaxID=68775 RepID=A0A5C3M972_9AGAR|nr:ribosomal protein L4 domain-containing protein [Crucibulum laeve]
MLSRAIGSTSRLALTPAVAYPCSARLSTATVASKLRSSIHHPPPPKQATPIQTPLFLSLTEPFKRGKGDPPPDGNVVVLDPTVFNEPVRRDILHLCTVHYLDSLRQGSANTKTRGEVRGSGIKIRPQKGSGRARLGDGQSPMLVGGGIAFGPKPRDFSTKLPRKVIQMGMRVALSVKMKENLLGVMSSLLWPCGRTKHLVHRIEALGLRKTLFITGEETPHVGLDRAIRNIPSVHLMAADKVNVYHILKHQRLVLDIKAVEYFERTLKKDTPLVPLSKLASI